MTTRKARASKSTAIYLIALIVIIIAFLMLGGGPWARGLMHGSGTIHMYNWNWPQILISLVIGFVLGWILAKRSH